jgi:hypothetical protein
MVQEPSPEKVVSHLSECVWCREWQRTVNTFNLVFSDNSVLKRSSIGEDEDCIRVASFCLASAGHAAAVGLEAAVEGARDLHGFLKSLGAGGGGDG